MRGMIAVQLPDSCLQLLGLLQSGSRLEEWVQVVPCMHTPRWWLPEAGSGQCICHEQASATRVSSTCCAAPGQCLMQPSTSAEYHNNLQQQREKLAHVITVNPLVSCQSWGNVFPILR